MNKPNSHKVEALKVWYAIFVTIMDLPDNDADDMKKLRMLRERLRKEAPELEMN